MCHLCQASTKTLSSSKGVESQQQCVCDSNSAASSVGSAEKMTWSKESIGNTSAVETTPSHGSPSNGGQKAPERCESIRHRRTVSTKFGHSRARDLESVRRKYLPKKRLTVHAPNKQPEESSPSTAAEHLCVEPSATQSPDSGVREVNNFSRASRHRRAFKGNGPRILPHEPIILQTTLPVPNGTRENNSFGCESKQTLTVDKCARHPVNPTLAIAAAASEQASEPVSEAEDDILRSQDKDLNPKQTILVTAEVHEDVGPEAIILQDDTENREDMSPCQDIGPEPMALVDTEAAAVYNATDESMIKEKRPSVLRRILDKSSSLVKRPVRGRNRQRGTMRRRGERRRVPKNRMVRRPRKVVVMGDMFSGKSNLISAYCRDRFTTNYIPTLLNACMTDAKVFGESIELVLIEVVGRDDLAKMRKIAYKKTDVIVLCYSADNSDSLQRIIDYWVPEIQCHAPKVPFILVATKKDVRDAALVDGEMTSDPSEEVVSTTRGHEVSKTIGAHSFIECSALYRDNTRHVFETAAKVALQKSRRKRKVRRNCQNECIIS